MAITATQPTEVPAKVYDRWWMERLVIDSPEPAAARVAASFRKYREAGGGGIEFQPGDERAGVIVDNVFALAAEDAEVAAIMGALLAKLEQLGKARGAL